MGDEVGIDRRVKLRRVRRRAGYRYGRCVPARKGVAVLIRRRLGRRSVGVGVVCGYRAVRYLLAVNRCAVAVYPGY